MSQEAVNRGLNAEFFQRSIELYNNTEYNVRVADLRALWMENKDVEM